MLRHRFSFTVGALAAVGLWAMQAGPCRAQSTISEPGPASGYTTGRPANRPAPGSTYVPGYTGLPTSVSLPIMMTTINTPGVYGAYSLGLSDINLYNREPTFYRAYNPREVLPSANVTVVPATSETTLAAALPQPETGTATVRVRVPADAQLWFEGVPTDATGTSRNFVTPALPVGRNFQYDVRASWRGPNGQEVTTNRPVTVRAGATVDVDFLAESPTLQARPGLPRP